MKRSIETEDRVVKKYKHEIFSSDKEWAKINDFNTKVISNDNEILYVSWSLLEGFEYFTKMRDSNLRDYRDKTIKLDLSKREAEKYLTSLFNLKIGIPFLIARNNFLEVMNIYKQADYHRITELTAFCNVIINNFYPYSIELYRFNKTSNIITPKDMAMKFYKTTQINLTPIFNINIPPQEDEELWGEIIKILGPICPIITYNIFRHLDDVWFKKYMLLYAKESHKFTITNITDIMRYTEFVKDNNLISFLSWCYKSIEKYDKIIIDHLSKSI